ncbi:MAG: hypothetical protein PHU85_10715 [Phycisphaerae bacterium]|nr:hypothetical protein [Phycisphaerae bacterium]
MIIEATSFVEKGRRISISPMLHDPRFYQALRPRKAKTGFVEKFRVAMPGRY